MKYAKIYIVKFYQLFLKDKYYYKTSARGQTNTDLWFAFDIYFVQLDILLPAIIYVNK